MIVNSNLIAKLTQRYLHRSTSSHADSMKKLASGSRINSAKDDAAGLQISNRLQAQRSGFEVAIRNASDATSMLQTAEGAMAEYTDNLMRMRDLTLQYANGVNSSEDHDAIRQEFNALKDELKRITETTSFGGQRLLNGTSGKRSFQIGANAGEAIHVQFPDLSNIKEKHQQVEGGTKIASYVYFKEDWRSLPGDSWRYLVYSGEEKPKELIMEIDPGSSMWDVAEQINDEYGDKIRVYVEKTDVEETKNHNGYRLVKYAVDDSSYYRRKRLEGPSWPDNYPLYWGGGKITINLEEPTFYTLPSLSNDNSPDVVIEQLDEILHYVDSERAKLGAVQNRLSHAVNNLSQSSENIAASNNQIRDTDFALEASRLAKETILKEANTAMLAQASKTPQEALNLLK